MRKLFLGLIFIALSCSSGAEDKPVVAIQPYKGFPESETKKIAAVIDSFYGCKSIIQSEIDLPAAAFTAIKSPRYRADSLIQIQKRNKHDSIDYVVGLTHKDICITKKDKNGQIKKPVWKYTDWGIMGLGYCPGPSCIVSSYRVQSKNRKLYLMRLKKVAVHELGHNFGLPHCPDKTCVMTDAVENIATIDHAQLALCAVCQKKLK